MRTKSINLVAILLLASASTAVAQTAWTYQGSLVDNDVAVTGDVDFIFELWDDPDLGSQIGPTLTFDGVLTNPQPIDVVDGVFAAQLDFGATPFDGQQLWLEVSVRNPSGAIAPYTTLTPRQPVTPTPYALHAASSADNHWMLSGANLTNHPSDFVGIHRATPVNASEFFGVQASVDDGLGGMGVRTDDGDGQPFYGYYAGTSEAWHYLDGPTGRWHLHNQGVRLTVDNTGNVGIGTTTPQFPLHVETTTGTGIFSVTIHDFGEAIRGETTNPTGVAVVGVHNHPNGSDPAVRGHTASGAQGAVGVHGLADRGTQGGTQTLETIGVLGESDSEQGVGVRGSAAANSGPNVGVWGETSSPAGFAGYFAGPQGSSSYFQRDVGIGELLPLAKLHVDSGNISLDQAALPSNMDVIIEDSDAYLGLYSNTGGANASALVFGQFDSGAGTLVDQWSIMHRTGGELRFQHGTTPAIDPSNWTLRLHPNGDLYTRSVEVYNPLGDQIIELRSAVAGEIHINDDLGSNRISLLSKDGNEGSTIEMKDFDGDLTLQLDADYNGSGYSRVITGELEITGGSDLSELFDVRPGDATEPEPGMLVCLDEDHPGQLIVSRQSYDRKVAGIISGANGVRTGMYMGQRGSAADGALPVALTGRVYCYADTTNGVIRPGDLLTTSNTPGHAMRVVDHAAAQGAVIGKAMSSLDEGRGLVLVLVNLQ